MAFPGGTAAESVAATLERHPDFAAVVEAPSPIRELLSRSLEKEPSKRLPSSSVAMELIDRAASELMPM